MNLDTIPTASPFLEFVWNAIDWLNPLVHTIGLAVAIWAFLRCRKFGYLVIGFYFALVLFSLFAMPSINRAIRARSEPNVSEQTQQKISAAVQQTIDRVIQEEGHPVMAHNRTLHFPFGPIVLVFGLWFLARREPNRCDTSLAPTVALPNGKN